MSTVIGIAGTAKNTGKTTTTSAILEELYKEDVFIGLTSIGYDGEELDNITGLPKPRVFLKEGTILATSEECLEVGSAGYEVLETTDIITPLGKLMIVKITQEGLAVVAGPNKSSELRRTLKILGEKLGCDVILVDGALNRIAPMIETEGVFLATGASRNVNIDSLVEEIKALYELFDLPELEDHEKSILPDTDRITLIPENEDDEISFLDYGFLIDENTVELIAERIDKIKAIYVPALISESMIKKLNDLVKSWKNKTLIIQDSLRLITGGNPERIIAEINRIKNSKGEVKILKGLPLLAVTVNPFYPLYRYDTKSYKPGYIDKDELVSKMQANVPIPIVDVKSDGSSKLTDIIFNLDSR